MKTHCPFKILRRTTLAHFNETWHPHVDTILNTTPAGSIDRKMGNQSYTRPHDHKLRKYLSLKLDFEYLKFYWTHCLNKSH